MTTDAAVIPPGALLAQPLAGPIEADQRLWGFGGFHGGLALALMTSAMQEHAPGARLRSATAHYHRPINGDFSIDCALVRTGRLLTSVRATATGAEGTHAEASAVFSPPGQASLPVVAPPAPAAPPPEECEVFTIPPAFVPIANQTEIRPVGAARPFAGGTEPELTAWIRLVEDDAPPDPGRFVFLMDSLAPSYAAILSTLLLIPTVELSVSVGDALADASSPWVLLRARTRFASASGWTTEDIDAWGPDGTHLGSARQLRVVRVA